MTDLSRDQIQAYHHAIWFFSPSYDYAREPGSFTASLFSTIAKADIQNRLKLFAGFPCEVEAFVLGAETERGIELMQKMITEYYDEQR